MGWTERHFQYQQRKWEARAAAAPADSSGLRAFAHRQALVWKDLLCQAQEAFDPILRPLDGIARADPE